MLKKGFAVVIKRKDGSEFLATSGSGVFPTVHATRTYAVQMRKGLTHHGFKCRVVPVNYSLPKVIKPYRINTYKNE